MTHIDPYQGMMNFLRDHDELDQLLLPFTEKPATQTHFPVCVNCGHAFYKHRMPGGKCDACVCADYRPVES